MSDFLNLEKTENNKSKKPNINSSKNMASQPKHKVPSKNNKVYRDDFNGSIKIPEGTNR